MIMGVPYFTEKILLAPIPPAPHPPTPTEKRRKKRKKEFTKKRILSIFLLKTFDYILAVMFNKWQFKKNEIHLVLTLKY